MATNPADKNAGTRVLQMEGDDPRICQQMFRAYMDADVECLIRGGFGVGKSSIVHLEALQRKVPLIDIRAALREPVDFSGIPHVVDDATRWAQPDFLPTEERDGPFGIIFFDEMLNATHATQNSLYQIVLDGRLNNWIKPKGWYVCAAANRPQDGAGVGKMLKPLANRFAHIEFGVSIEATEAYWESKDLDMLVLGFLKHQDSSLLYNPEAGDGYGMPTPRSWEEACKFVGYPPALRRKLIGGVIGQGPAMEFCGWLEAFETCPTYDEVVADPVGAKLPPATKPSLCFAVSMQMARKAKAEHASELFAYVSRLPREHMVNAVTQLVRHCPAMQRTSAFVAWATLNPTAVL